MRPEKDIRRPHAAPWAPGDDTEEIEAERSQWSAVEKYGVVSLQSLCFRPGHVALLAAPTSWGKSSLCVMVADQNIELGVPTLVVSVEDSVEAAAAPDIPFLYSAVGTPVGEGRQGHRGEALVKDCGIRLVICDYAQRF